MFGPHLRRAGLALSLALTLAAGATPALARPEPAAPKPAVEVTAADRAAFREGARQGGESMVLLMEAFPAEYEAYETEVIVGVKSGKLDLAAVQQLSFQWAAGLRARMMGNASKASDADLVAIGRAQLELMRGLSADHPRACSEFVEQGGLSQQSAFELDDDSRKAVDHLGAQQLRAALAATKAPVARKPIGDAEVMPMLAAFRKNGGDIQWLAAAGKPDALAKFTDQDRCANARRWLETLLAQPPGLAARLLAN